MTELALGENIKIKASNIEFSLPKPSFTIDTLSYLKEKYPAKEFVLIMGADNIESLDKWKNYESLLAENEIFVYKRPGSIENLPSFIQGKHHIAFIDAPLLEISSSYIRERIRQNLDFRYLVTDAVHKYIVENRLYK